MRLATVTLARDEADIIERFVRHNLHFVDRLYVVDDGSTDATPDILRLLAAEGVPLVVVSDGVHGAYHQGVRTTALMHRAMADEAFDFILPLDADEFIALPDRAALEAELASLPAGAVGAFSMTHYIPQPQDDLTETDPLARLTYVLDIPRQVNKVVVPRSLAAHPETLISDGNHGVSHWHKDVAPVLLPNADLAHFPVRSTDQLVAKCLASYVRWRARPDYQATTAIRHMDGARLLAAEPALAVSDPAALLAAYIPESVGPLRRQPFTDRRGALRYPHLAQAFPYRRIMSALDTLVETGRAGARELEVARRTLEKRNAPFREALAARLRKLKRSFMKRMPG
ncbi:glycosyltransferase family 2 protein [Aquabacter sp. P-9]|uniref:glycosyltransferase family 2 protein n=1 Tax=Aquabacter sediminis TaxID=3029197 RepID=UPI00237DC922|nr:glycosyltransferase family 2 protein [Aquabacter sp. P-9]MDE1566650.1 glycosyltransferase family 2 protein [Aquabacter sp. P-9]